MNFYELPDEIKELIPAYLENRFKEHQLLCELLTNGNIEEINRIGHKLAGNAGSYGLNDLGKIGEQLEIASLKDDLNHLLMDYIKLIQSYQKSL